MEIIHTAHEHLNTHQKALAINLDKRPYGTFAEIGAGQEVARWFFRVGGAAGTIAKTISAYDMKVSDEIYGKAARFVIRDRLIAMFDHEYSLLIERLDAQRGADTTFFVFADTVSARDFRGIAECHGWLGVRLQRNPRTEPVDVLIHVNLHDPTNVMQQEVLGILGVNLLHSSLYKLDNLDEFLTSLYEGLSLSRVDIDAMEFRGAGQEGRSGAELAVKLIEHGITRAVTISPQDALCVPTDLFHKRPVLIERGTFREVAPFHEELLKKGELMLSKELVGDSKPPLSLFEISLMPLPEVAGEISPLIDYDDVIRRVKSLYKLGKHVMVTRFAENYRAVQHLRRFTLEPVGFALGVATIVRVLDGRIYQGLAGGILEALGRLLSLQVKLFAYPMSAQDVRAYLMRYNYDLENWEIPPEGLITADKLLARGPLRHLHRYLLETQTLIALR